MQAFRHEKVKRRATGDPAIGERIKAARVRRDLTQEQLAALVGASKAAVSQWEAGKTAIDDERVAKLSLALGIPLESLIPVLPGTVVLAGDARLFLELFLQLRPENRQPLLQILQALVAAQRPLGG